MHLLANTFKRHSRRELLKDVFNLLNENLEVEDE